MPSPIHAHTLNAHIIAHSINESETDDVVDSITRALEQDGPAFHRKTSMTALMRSRSSLSDLSRGIKQRRQESLEQHIVVEGHPAAARHAALLHGKVTDSMHVTQVLPRFVHASSGFPAPPCLSPYHIDPEV